MTITGQLVRRAATASDDAFLRSLFADTRAAEFAAVPVQLRDSLLEMQFVAQLRHYTATHPGSRREIVELDGSPVGAIWLAVHPDATHIVDVSVAPQHRGRGIGTQLLAQVLAGADRSGTAVRLQVWSGNLAARRLYARLGFVQLGSAASAETGGYLTMERTATSQPVKEAP